MGMLTITTEGEISKMLPHQQVFDLYIRIVSRTFELSEKMRKKYRIR